jgi:hypothetical protein
MRDELLVRGIVKKNLAKFVGYVQMHGTSFVYELLATGKNGKYRLTVAFNRKDRMQMIEMLGLTKPKRG